MISTTYIAVIVNVLAVVLPKLGIEVGSDQLTGALQTLIVVVSGLWVLVKRYKQGGISVLGVRKP